MFIRYTDIHRYVFHSYGQFQIIYLYLKRSPDDLISWSLLLLKI